MNRTSIPVRAMLIFIITSLPIFTYAQFQLVADINPHGSSSDVSDLTNVNGTTFFFADDGTHGKELWKSDGTTGGTSLVKDINPGAAPSPAADVRQNTAVNNMLFFAGNNGTAGDELWKTDGTAAGTVMVKDIVPGPASANLDGLTNVNGVLYFFSTTGTNTNLWKSDGTAGGTVLVKSFPVMEAQHPVVFQNKLFFAGLDQSQNYEIWSSDGTAAGTTILKNISSNAGSGSLTLLTLAVHNGKLYFVYDIDVMHRSVWTSDGTSAGTTSFFNLYTGSRMRFTSITSANGLLYIPMERSPYMIEELWRSDGTAAGTFQLRAFNSDRGNSFYIVINALYQKVLFPAHDTNEGTELWETDGTVAGTKLLKDIAPGTAAGVPNPTMIVFNNLLFFGGSDPYHQSKLWRSDGTPNGTYMTSDFNGSRFINFFGMVVAGNRIMISAGIPDRNSATPGNELYKYEGPAVTPGAVRINSAGPAYAGTENRPFAADGFFSGSSQVSTATSTIQNTTDPALYRDQRFGSAFNYAIPVANGPVNVVLHFSENFFGVAGKGGMPGIARRLFNVDIEGSRKLTDYDIFAKAGGALRARKEVFAINVFDGVLNINFSRGQVDNPIVAAIEVLPNQELTFTTIDDAMVKNDKNGTYLYGKDGRMGVKSGSLPSYLRNAYVKFLLDGVDYVQSAKMRIYGGILSYLPGTVVPITAYGVEDDSWSEYTITWNNAPPSSGSPTLWTNVTTNNQYYELDVTAYVRSQIATDKTISMMITNPGNNNTELSFLTRELPYASPPQLVIQTAVSPTARMSAEEKEDFSEITESTVFPNPAGKRFTVRLATKHSGNVSMQMVNSVGQTYLIRPIKSDDGSGLSVDLTSMRTEKGIYILDIKSNTHHEALKVLVTD